ncbi:MAG TPA: S41 family peptidase [Terriglobia bacterium]|nr:S41 family peptidase [Terriglobia bacterium]
MSNRVRFLLISVSCILVFYIVFGGLLGKSASTTNTNDKAYRDLGVYSEVLDRIKSDYVTDPDMKKVTDGAIRGLLEALDPYSTYFTPQQYQEYQQHPDPGPGQVGIFVSKRGGYAEVIAVLAGSPADKAEVKAGDLLDEISDIAPRELSVVQIDRMMAGPVGSTVTLSLVSGARSEPHKVTLTRQTPDYPPVTAKMVEDGTGYLRVSYFSKGAAGQIEAKLKELTAQGASKIVLDLRDCAGGEPDEAFKTAGLFIDKGLVAYLAGQRYPRHDVEVEAASAVSKSPLAVLINQSTAGPAELVASAVLNNKRGDVVGTRSWGDGVVQKLIPVGDGSALLLSVAKYYGPDGKTIQDNGITPNVIQAPQGTMASADSDEEENGAESPEQLGGKNDLQLQKALEVLKQHAAKSTAVISPAPASSSFPRPQRRAA